MTPRLDITPALHAVGLIGIAAVLTGAYFFQLGLGELPCPLCLLQRVGFAGVAFGLLLNVRYGQKPLHVGIVILAALFGMSVAGRHVLIHIAPGTGSYGSAVFGLHLYTWAFVLFGVSILGAAVLLILQPAQPQTGPSPLSAVATFAGWWVIALTLVNAITTFVECGPIECPANPTRYWLFG